MERVRALVTVALYPGVLVGSLAIAALQLDAGVAPGIVVATATLWVAPLCLALERFVPASPGWRLDAAEARTDVLHALLSNPIPSAIFRTLFYVLVVGASERITAWIGIGLWPLQWPLAAQLALAVPLVEAVSYAIHRMLHETSLWPLHAVHHCSPRMYFLLAVRKHPIQAFVTYGGRLAVLWLLGAPVEIVTLHTVLASANSYVQHANVALRTGPLGWVLATPEIHRLHHSRREDELGRNYGDVMIVWDRLFGTFRAPGRATPEVGLPGIEVPQTYRAHLALPFRWSRLHERA